MDKKKLKILLALSVLCLICVLSEAYRRGYISLDNVVQVSNNSASKDKKEDKNNKDKTDSSDKKEKSDGADDGVKASAKSEDVRVLIMTDGFEEYYHNSVRVTCGNDFTITSSGRTRTYKAGRKVLFKMSDSSLKSKKFIVKSTGKARIKLLSIKRQNINPMYRGSMEIRWNSKGFLLTNELPLEQYLYAVVPSEMSTGNRMEALKAQAVCARSYTYNQINAERYKDYNADLDDSVSCQVYNNIPEDARSRKAVNSTCGKVITSGNKIIVAYYFSTSWGCTADGQDVWNTSNEVSYLKSRLQTNSKSVAADSRNIDLSDENEFREFIDVSSVETYDSDEDWYRWKVTYNANKLSSRIDSALYNCYMSNKSLVLTQNPDGTYEEKLLKSIGRIKKIRVEKREESGLVTELVIVGTENVVKVCTQYNIRKVLAPVYEKIYRKGGDSISSYSMLPSAAFYIDELKNAKGATLFRVTGGGFGHGTGLSQAGAAVMAKSGSRYTEILKHYFAGIRIKDVNNL